MLSVNYRSGIGYGLNFREAINYGDRGLRKRNVTFEELIFPNEIHDFLLHRHWVEAYQATADFFARKLKEPVQSAAK